MASLNGTPHNPLTTRSNGKPRVPGRPLNRDSAVPSKKLSDIERKFINAYLTNGLSITNAALTAGYSEQSAASQGTKVRWRPNVAQEIDRRIRKAEDTADVKVAEVIREARQMALSDVAQVFEDDGAGMPKLRKWGDLPKHVTRAIKKIKVDTYTEGRGDEAREVLRVEVTMHDKLGPLELLAKYLKIIGDKGSGDTNNTLIVFQNALSKSREVLTGIAGRGSSDGAALAVSARPLLSAPSHSESE